MWPASARRATDPATTAVATSRDHEHHDQHERADQITHVGVGDNPVIMTPVIVTPVIVNPVSGSGSVAHGSILAIR